MTQQEFVKKESEMISKESTLHGTKLYADGLTKGLEIAKEFRDWVKNEAWKHDFTEQKSHTTAELLTIFLTEKYGK